MKLQKGIGILAAMLIVGCNSNSNSLNGQAGNPGSKASSAEGRDQGGCNGAASPYGGGNGKEGNPYLICSVEQLKSMLDTGTQEYFALTADLDLAHEAKYLGTALTGALDGRGHTLRNFSLYLPMEGTPALIGQLFSFNSFTAGVKNLNLENFNIKAEHSEGSAGTLFSANNGGIIENVHVSGQVMGLNYVGGIAGQNSGIIRNSSFSGTIQGQIRVGGITGWADSFSIEGCDAEGSVAGFQYVGGIVGLAEKKLKLENNRVGATITGDQDFGKEVGKRRE